MNKELLENYAYLFESDLIDEITEVGVVKKLKAREVIIDYGQELRHIPFLIDGALKIMRQNENGDELLLYFLEEGDTCAMSLSCCMRQTQSEIQAIAERDSTLVLIPIEKMGEWMRKYEGWMSFVFESYNNRFNEMLESIDSLAFNNMHDRLFKYLKNKVMIDKTTTLEITHQEIALDMNSSRVVISRLLKSLEIEKKIEIFRNRIEVREF
ncbi:MAG: CRP/FNR family transcriptional regulator [Crocinitomicaceae bacterium]|jgi:CRP/FNR family transcriptional regulator